MCVLRSEGSLVKPPLSTFMWLWEMSGSNDFLENILKILKIDFRLLKAGLEI